MAAAVVCAAEPAVARQESSCRACKWAAAWQCTAGRPLVLLHHVQQQHLQVASDLVGMCGVYFIGLAAKLARWFVCLLLCCCSYNKTLLKGFAHPLTVTNIQVGSKQRPARSAVGHTLSRWHQCGGGFSCASRLLPYYWTTSRNSRWCSCGHSNSSWRSVCWHLNLPSVCVVLQFAIGSVLSLIFWATGFVKPPKLDARLVRSGRTCTYTHML